MAEFAFVEGAGCDYDILYSVILLCPLLLVVVTIFDVTAFFGFSKAFAQLEFRLNGYIAELTDTIILLSFDQKVVCFLALRTAESLSKSVIPHVVHLHSLLKN